MELRTLDQLLDALVAAAASEYAPGVDGLSHGLQCAARLADFAPGDLELQVAGLVHDVAASVTGTDSHAAVGADAVRPVFGGRIASLVRAHTAALRYLASTDARYLRSLVPGSIEELRRAGGLMDPIERTALEIHPDFPALLQLRRADDLAVIPGLEVPGLAAWCPHLAQLVDTRTEQAPRRVHRSATGGPAAA